MRFLILGRSVRKKKKIIIIIKLEKGLELGGRVPQHNIRGAWNQHGEVSWRQWTKKKSTSLSKSNAKVTIV